MLSFAVLSSVELRWTHLNLSFLFAAARGYAQVMEEKLGATNVEVATVTAADGYKLFTKTQVNLSLLLMPHILSLG